MCIRDSISPKLGGDFKGAGAGLSPSYSFGACAAEVTVDPRTGRVKILDVWGAHDCGKALNPLAVEAVSYTHLDAADERSSVDLGGRRIIKKKRKLTYAG